MNSEEETVFNLEKFKRIYNYDSIKIEYVISIRSIKWIEEQINNLMCNINNFELLINEYVRYTPHLYLVVMDNVISYYFKPHIERMYSSKRIPMLSYTEIMDFISFIIDKPVEDKEKFHKKHGFYPVRVNINRR